MQPQKLVPLLAVGLAFTATSSYGAAFDLPDQDAFAVGRGMAFAATADNPSAIYYNPAGITQLEGLHLRGGIYGIYLDPSYEPFSPGRGAYHNQAKLNAVPQLFSTYGKEDSPVTFGFGVYAPFGLGLRWPDDTGFRTIATEGSLQYITLNPVVGVELFPGFSVAGGITVNYAKTDLRQGLFSPNRPTDEFRFVGDGWDVGYNLGALWKVHEKVFIGASFRSGTRVNLNGHTEIENDVPLPGPIPPFSQRRSAEADFAFPLKVIAGVSYRPTPKWNLEFNVDYTDWDAIGTVTIQQSSPSLILPRNIPLTLNWQSSYYYEFGATRYLDNGWHVSAGYIYNENSVPDANYTPLVTDLDRHFFSLGTGFKGKRYDLDFAYQFGYGAKRTVTGSAPSQTGQTADGDYHFISHAIAVSVGVHF